MNADIPERNDRAELDTAHALPRVIARVAKIIDSDSFPTGYRAGLRRTDPRDPPSLAFYRFAFRCLPADWERCPEAWQVIIAGLAITSPGGHLPSRPMGTVLAATGFSEKRLERLLSANGQVMRALVLRLARFTAAKRAGFDWTDTARLVLTTNGRRREKIRLRIARHFYSNTSAKE